MTNKNSLVEAIRDCICQGQIREAEVLLHSFRFIVEDNSDLTQMVRTLSWRQSPFARWTAPRYLSSPELAISICEEIEHQLTTRNIVKFDLEDVINNALRYVSEQRGNIMWSHTISQRIALRIVMATLDIIKGDANVIAD